MDDFFSGIKGWFSKPQWNPQLAKTHLKLAMSRMKLQGNKKQNANSAGKREAAQLLKEGKEAQAKLRVETIIREENNIKALSQLDVICEHILARFDSLNMTSLPPPDLHGAICSVIFSSPRLDIVELRQLAQNFELKYGKEFLQEALANKYHTVHEKILETLTMSRPAPALVDAYLLEIAQENDIQWQPDDLAAAKEALKLLHPELAAAEAEAEQAAFEDEIPDVPTPALDLEDFEADEDLLKELDKIRPPQQQQQPNLLPSIGDEDNGDDDAIPDDIPTPNFGFGSSAPAPAKAPVAPKPQFHQQAKQHPQSQPQQKRQQKSPGAAPSAAPRSGGSTSTSGARLAPSNASKASQQSQQPPPSSSSSDDFDLDLPEVPAAPPKKYFPGGGPPSDGGDFLLPNNSANDDDLEHLLPQVPPTAPHPHAHSPGGPKSSFGTQSNDFGSSMATLARKHSQPTAPTKPSSSSAAPDDDELMARFKRLRDSN